jgi:2-dehydro-3-deoxyphosphogluconate aldolase/(4S)-4-hydroxy-2-oxoglutarate aldolase
MDAAPVIAVVTIERVEDAVPIAEALIAGGIFGVEVTLRSSAALGAIAAIARSVPRALIGAGTIRNAEQVARAVDAGARFLVSPGATPRLLDVVAQLGLPYLPGVATLSEAMAATEYGFDHLKLFPAATVGLDFVKSAQPVLPEVRFCPTGGITEANAASWLALPNVGCVGGSWLVPKDAVAAGRFDVIEAKARAASLLRAPPGA